MITATSFRLDYPEFHNQAIYPNSVVNYWITVAGLLLTTIRWGNGSAAATSPPSTIYDVASELFVAHNLVLEKQAQDTARRGGTPGVSKGAISSDSVGGVSRSYDTASGLEPEAGHWNLTTYGTRFKRLSDLYGAGPIQVGACDEGGSPWTPGFTPQTFLPATGTITFTLNPTPGSTVGLGGATVTFVTSGATGLQVDVAATLSQTMVALAQLLSTTDDEDVSASNYAISTPDPPAVVLNVAYKQLGPTGTSFTLATTVTGAVVSGPTLEGPPTSNDNGFGQDPWLGPPPWPGVTSFG